MRLLVVLVSSLLATGSAGAQSHPQDLLKESWIRSAWSQMLRGEALRREDSWIPRLDGVGSAPFPYRDGAGVSWLVGQLCQPHNCSDNKLVVVVDRERRRVWALQQTAYPISTRFFGNPDRATADLLRLASSLDPNKAR